MMWMSTGPTVSVDFTSARRSLILQTMCRKYAFSVGLTINRACNDGQHSKYAHRKCAKVGPGRSGEGCTLQHGNDEVEVVAIDRTNVVQAQLLKEGGSRPTDHAARVLVNLCCGFLQQSGRIPHMPWCRKALQ